MERTSSTTVLAFSLPFTFFSGVPVTRNSTFFFYQLQWLFNNVFTFRIIYPFYCEWNHTMYFILSYRKKRVKSSASKLGFLSPIHASFPFSYIILYNIAIFQRCNNVCKFKSSKRSNGRLYLQRYQRMLFDWQQFGFFNV